MDVVDKGLYEGVERLVECVKGCFVGQVVGKMLQEGYIKI